MTPTDGPRDGHEHSKAFVVRVWREALGNGKSEWRGRVQSIRSGQSLYFREWSSLLHFLQGAGGEDSAGEKGEATVNPDVFQ